MYKEYFGLKELPFSIAPDPRYLYMSDEHREALAHLLYGINSEGGFVLLTGEVGTGKTTVCRCLLEQIPENTDIAFVLNPKMTVEELLATICDELGILYPEGNTSIKVFVDRINSYLLDAYARGRKTVLIIEEAQNLSPDVLEQVRLLTNLESNQCKLLQIIMLGQPELKEMLSRPELRQLAQRITARYHLSSLSKKEVSGYINHRLTVAGTRNRLFPDSIMGKVYGLSGGIPRLINILCDRALLGVYVDGKEQVDRSTLIKAAREVFGESEIKGYYKKMFRWILAGLAFVGCAALVAALITPGSEQQKSFTVPAAERPTLSGLDRPAGNLVHQSKGIVSPWILRQGDIAPKTDDGRACLQAYGSACPDIRGSLYGLPYWDRTALLNSAEANEKPVATGIRRVK